MKVMAQDPLIEPVEIRGLDELDRRGQEVTY